MPVTQTGVGKPAAKPPAANLQATNPPAAKALATKAPAIRDYPKSLPGGR